MTDPELRLFIIQEEHRHDGFLIAFLPSTFSLDQAAAALKALEVRPHKIVEVTDWRTTDDGVAVAFIPLPETN